VLVASLNIKLLPTDEETISQLPSPIPCVTQLIFVDIGAVTLFILKFIVHKRSLVHCGFAAGEVEDILIQNSQEVAQGIPSTLLS